jgi:hypothetical protein
MKKMDDFLVEIGVWRTPEDDDKDLEFSNFTSIMVRPR